MASVTLSKPLDVNGAPLAAVTLNLDALTGADVELAAREAQIAGGGGPIAVLSLDPGFHLQLAACASGLDVATLRKLGARDYLAVVQAVQGFLFGTD